MSGKPGTGSKQKTMRDFYAPTPSTRGTAPTPVPPRRSTRNKPLPPASRSETDDNSSFSDCNDSSDEWKPRSDTQSSGEEVEEEEEEEEEDDDDEDTSAVPPLSHKRVLGKKQRKRQRTGSIPGEEEQPGTSLSSTPGQRKKKKPTYSSPLKKGDKKDISTWVFYKVQIPVTCGNKKGMLCAFKLAKGRGEKCILAEKKEQWITASAFEKFGGKETTKNWRNSIKCQHIPLRKLLQDGHLTCPLSTRTKTKK